MKNTDNRDSFYASVRAIDALCPACKQPQNAPSCERRQHAQKSAQPAQIEHTVYGPDDKTGFLAAERQAVRAFIDKHTLDDFTNGMGHYSRQYRCECGFSTSDAERIWEHRCTP